jgi:hypothetical protein
MASVSSARQRPVGYTSEAFSTAAAKNPGSRLMPDRAPDRARALSEDLTTHALAQHNTPQVASLVVAATLAGAGMVTLFLGGVVSNWIEQKKREAGTQRLLDDDPPSCVPRNVRCQLRLLQEQRGK